MAIGIPTVYRPLRTVLSKSLSVSVQHRGRDTVLVSPAAMLEIAQDEGAPEEIVVRLEPSTGKDMSVPAAAMAGFDIHVPEESRNAWPPTECPGDLMCSIVYMVRDVEEMEPTGTSPPFTDSRSESVVCPP